MEGDTSVHTSPHYGVIWREENLCAPTGLGAPGCSVFSALAFNPIPLGPTSFPPFGLILPDTHRFAAFEGSSIYGTHGAGALLLAAIVGALGVIKKKLEKNTIQGHIWKMAMAANEE